VAELSLTMRLSNLVVSIPGIDRTKGWDEPSNRPLAEGL
jgi:hypothetical protein